MRTAVATVLKSGGDFTVDHVHRLAHQVLSNSEVRFFCLSDVDTNSPIIEHIPLLHDWPGWWSKIELFRPSLWHDVENVLYLDLDTTVVGDVDPLAQVAGFTMLSDFYRPEQPASGVMAWPGGDQPSEVYTRFGIRCDFNMREYRSASKWGDQGFIRDALAAEGTPTPLRFTQQGRDIVSYKAHCLDQKTNTAALPAGARVVCFHGQPRPWDIGVRWRPEIAA